MAEEARTPSLSEFATSVKDLEQVAPPVTIRFQDVFITILEVTKVESKHMREYFVTVMFERRGARTRPFTIPCRDVHDLARKLREEVLKFRIMSRLGTLPPGIVVRGEV